MIENYHIVKEVGRGGMGCVYEAIDPAGRRVALKMVKNSITYDPEMRQLFITEAAMLRKMKSRYVVSITAEPFSDKDGNFYLPMEFVDGETISQYMARRGAFSESDALQLMDQILQAMSYIHSRGGIHRDLKPSNIMLRPDGSVCIIDFGIAKDARTSTGHTVGRIIGTDGYMSPEQASGLNIDKRTDIYSLGCVLHFLVTGQNAFNKRSNDEATRMAILNERFPSAMEINPSISQRTQDIIYKAVDRNMMRRFQSTEEFRNALFGTGAITNSTQAAGSITLDKRISVGRIGTDIVKPNPKVSRNHAIIKISSDGVVRLEDTSSNGTYVNGELLHHTSTIITPQDTIMLAGVEKLSWGEIDAFIPRPPVVDVFSHTDNLSGGNGNHPSTGGDEEDKLNYGLRFLSAILPPVGLILYFSWKNSYPAKARMALSMAASGIAIYIVTLSSKNL